MAQTEARPDDTGTSALETAGDYKVVVPGHTLKIRVERDPDDPDTQDDKVVLLSAEDDGKRLRRSVALTDASRAKEIEDGVTEITFPAVPKGRYSVYLDLGKDALGEDEGGYFIVQDTAFPFEKGQAQSDPDPEPEEADAPLALDDVPDDPIEDPLDAIEKELG